MLLVQIISIFIGQLSRFIFLKINIFLTSIIQEGIFFLQALSFIRKAGKVAFLLPSQQKVMPAQYSSLLLLFIFQSIPSSYIALRVFSKACHTLCHAFVSRHSSSLCTVGSFVLFARSSLLSLQQPPVQPLLQLGSPALSLRLRVCHNFCISQLPNLNAKKLRQTLV